MPSLADEQICLDGTTLRDSRLNGKALHRLSAYAAKVLLVFDAGDSGRQVQRNYRYPRDKLPRFI
ncbi:MAG: hypothetical protein Q7U66_08535 [Methylobacter sp.]|nr:hypothetical protein [Methylobacter sp.]